MINTAPPLKAPVAPAPDSDGPAAAVPGQIQQAIDQFNAAGRRIETFYRRLSEEVQRLNGELEQRNRQLRGHLAEKERMQGILVSALQSLTIGVLAVGQDGIVIVANPAACAMFDLPLEQLATRHIEQVLAPVAASHELLLTLQGSPTSSAQVMWRTRAGGVTREIQLTAATTPAPFDRHLAGVILAEDQTALRRLEQQANLRNRLQGMGAVAMNLAHEIRNPLGSMALFASALERELAGDESLGPLASHILGGIKSLEHIVANTLEFARPRRMSMAPVELGGLIEQTLSYVEHPLAQNGIEVDVRIQPRPAAVRADAEQLRQVLLNLFINAIQAMEGGGRLSVALDGDAGAGYRLRIADTGHGIDGETRERIFDPFFTTREKGSGIGLAVVHNILSVHGAQIDVESEVGEGTTFQIRFAPAEV